MVLQLHVELRQGGVQLCGGDVPSVPSIAVAGNATQCRSALSADEYGRTGLHRLGETQRAGEVHEFAVKGALLLRPRGVQRRQVFIAETATGGEVHVQCRKLFGQPSDTDAELESSCTEVIKRGHLAGPEQRMTQRQQRNRRTHPKCGGVHGRGLAGQERIKQSCPFAHGQCGPLR